ncbi:MAG: photosynthetic reaction center cytochrome c subunit family protein, partial [Candidatus Sulfotelmatobacter sp.]
LSTADIGAKKVIPAMQRPTRIPLLVLIIGPILLAIVSYGRGQSSDKPVAHSDVHSDAQTSVPPLLKEPTGAARCQFCHASEVQGYARSAMAHSLRRAGQEPDGTVDTPDAKITMYSSPTGYWQQLQSGGDVTSYRIDYVIGSGDHASGYLLDLSGHLYQSPVAYYKSRQAYDLAPGYEGRPNPDFTRPVAEACVFCHSGDALHVSGTSNRYRTPPFSAEAITCERCHGSAERHLSDPRAGTIVNPAKLEPAARNSICEQCHLLGVGRVLNPGKKFDDFRPGQPLEDIFTTYVNVSPPGADAGKFKVISHVEQLARSTCARKSNGRLWCGTCHDPHNKPDEPVRFYRSKCLSCHMASFPASHPAKDSNCIGCHMPRRDAKDGGHTAFTDHRIQRRPEAEQALPEGADIAAWREPAADLQKRNLGIAYVNAGLERRSAPFINRGYRMLTEIQDLFSNDDQFFTTIGSALLLAKQTSEAELAFERALQLNPNSATGETNAASAYLQGGDINRAVAHLESAVAIDPLHLPADIPLIDLYKQQGNMAKATEISDRLSAAMNNNSESGETGDKASPGGSVRTAESVFKNIQVLRGVPSDQIPPAMRFITAALGVQCSYCHELDHFDRDDKKPKQIARDMMRMMFAIDKDNFAGYREVTCYSCHRGSLKPQGVPMIDSETQAKQQTATAPGLEKLNASMPTSEELIDRYVRALGGVEAIGNVTSREEKGIAITGGQSVGIEIFDQDPEKQAFVRHTQPADSITGFNGLDGWFETPGHPIREMHGADLDAARIDADLHFPLHLKQIFSELRVEYPEKIGDRKAYVISGRREGQPPLKLYFDEQSGLLVRLVRYADSPLGLAPTQLDYGDYRDVEGVQTPFRWTITQPEGTSTIQLKEIRQNVPIDNVKFAKPAWSESKPPRP